MSIPHDIIAIAMDKAAQREDSAFAEYLRTEVGSNSATANAEVLRTVLQNMREELTDEDAAMVIRSAHTTYGNAQARGLSPDLNDTVATLTVNLLDDQVYLEELRESYRKHMSRNDPEERINNTNDKGDKGRS